MEDPCNYCINKHGINDINGINNCCYQQCANFMGTTDMDTIINSPCGKNCKKCMDKAKKATGRSLCYLRGIKPPLVWNFTEGFDRDKSGCQDSEGYQGYQGYQGYMKVYPLAFYLSVAISLSFLLLVLMIMIKVIFGEKK